VLTLTDNAAAIVTTLVSRQSDEPDAGLRIHSTATESPNGDARLAVLVTTAPEPADRVLEISGTRLFLDEAATTALEDKILHAAWTARERCRSPCSPRSPDA